MTKYEIVISRYSSNRNIREIEVERETESSIWVHGKRRAKRSAWENYHDTWEEAKAALLENAENKVTAARLTLEREKGYLGNVKGLKQ